MKMTWQHILFGGTGRLRRRDYWIWCLCTGFGAVFVHFLVHTFLFGLESKEFLADMGAWAAGQFTPFSIYMLICFPVLAWISVCLMAKRLHDRNRSGWLAGVLFASTQLLAVGRLNFILQAQDGASPVMGTILGFVSFVINIYVLIELGCLDGTAGRNQYGPSPKGRGDEAAVF